GYRAPEAGAVIRDRRTSIVLASTIAFGLVGIVVTACGSNDDEPGPPPGSDGGDSSVSDARDDGAGDATARDAGADVLVDATPPAVTCTTVPCAVEIAAGADSACVRLNDGTVRCWGSNGGGELGRGPDAGSSATAPEPVVGLNDATQISGSPSPPSDVYCALRAGGAAVCWGSNDNGVLGRVSEGNVVTESSPTPEPVVGIGPATGVFAGYHVSCATLGGNDVACWGSNAAAQLAGQPQGSGVVLPSTTFALAAKSRTLAVADRGTVALTEGGLVSWGLSGEPVGPATTVLGRESSTGVAPPATVDLPLVSAVAASGGRACAIANGRVYCWGAGPTAGSDSVYPTLIGVGAATRYAQTIAVGPRSACATVSDGSAYCWGDNSRGQLGSGDFELQPTPVRVQGLAGPAVRMAVMEATTCAILQTGAVQCWGQNDKGQLGTGTADALPHLEPQNVVLTP
ncbi:MAG: regulator of chromosome condensation, partial [Labilithrix sp.]|nr:regulator of chromosome condensation [Labilithrix sp.]